VVEEQKRRKLGLTLVVEHGMDGEAIAHPVPFGLLVDAENGFHGVNMAPTRSGIKMEFVVI
jgi:hypothetical protein